MRRGGRVRGDKDPLGGGGKGGGGHQGFHQGLRGEADKDPLGGGGKEGVDLVGGDPHRAGEVANKLTRWMIPLQAALQPWVALTAATIYSIWPWYWSDALYKSHFLILQLDPGP